MTHHAEIAEKCLVGFLKNFDISVLDTYSADSFKAIVHPESLEKREREKAEYLKSRAKLAGNFKQCTLVQSFAPNSDVSDPDTLHMHSLT
jgi:hypothetical protein